jgi:hypothetical protein
MHASQCSKCGFRLPSGKRNTWRIIGWVLFIFIIILVSLWLKFTYTNIRNDINETYKMDKEMRARTRRSYEERLNALKARYQKGKKDELSTELYMKAEQGGKRIIKMLSDSLTESK